MESNFHSSKLWRTSTCGDVMLGKSEIRYVIFRACMMHTPVADIETLETLQTLETLTTLLKQNLLHFTIYAAGSLHM